MNSQQPTKQPIRKPQISHIGQPIAWDSQALADLSHISPADLRHAADLWQSLAPAGYKGLLSASQEEEKTNHVVSHP